MVLRSLSYGQLSPTPSGSSAISRSSERVNPCLLLLVLWVVLVWDSKKKKKKSYCMHRGRCSCPSGTSYWYGVFIFQLNICLLRERSGHPTFKFRNHVLFDSVTCIPYRSCLGEEVLLVWGGEFQLATPAFLYLLLKLLVSKIMPILSLLQGGILFSMFLS